MTGTQFRKLVLGRHPFIPSHAEYKRIVLTAQVSILTIAICFIFIVMDLYEGVSGGLVLSFLCISIALLSIVLNRAGRHRTAKIILGFSVNLTTFIFLESEPVETGLYLFFIPASIGAIALFGMEEFKTALFFILISIGFFVFSVFSDFSLLPRIVGSGDYITFNLLVNFLTALMTSVIVVYFLVNVNHKSEKVLKENDQQISAKNEELIKLNTELDKFMYSTSHDLRSPISSVLGLIQLAKMSNDPAEMKGYMDMMEERLGSLNKFIKDISDYSRNARTDIRRQPVRVQRLVNDIVKSLKFYPGAERIKARVEIDADFELHTDATRLHIILSNLISNSFKYIDSYKENPFVKVSAELNSTTVHLVVEDNGIGIPENSLPRIFDMFFQAHEKSEGSGLGLYIVKEAVAKLNGTIDAESKLESGSRFVIQLPLEAEIIAEAGS